MDATKNDYDVLIVGSGNAGQSASRILREAGKSVAMVEVREFGGTCALRGCVPKKVLVAAAEAMNTISSAAVHGIQVGPATLDWPKLIARERTFVDGTPADEEAGLRSRGVTLLRGRARFVDRRALEVDGRRVQAAKIVIATGSVPAKMDLPGEERLITSEDLLKRPARPASIVFVGAGVIAFEFAHVLARAGTRVTLLESAPRALGRLEPDVVARLVAATEELGIRVLTDVKVTAIEQAGPGLVVRYEQGGKPLAIEAEAAAHGAGRHPDLADLDLGRAGIKLEKGAVKLDEHLCSVENEDVYFAGDAVAGAPQLSPVASYHGRIVGHNLTRPEPEAPEYEDIPSVVYSIPALASVGLGEQAARDKGLSFDVKAADMKDWRSARTYAEKVAFAKVLIEKGSDRILGAHILGHGAADLIHAFSFAMRHKVTASALEETIYAYPTCFSDIEYILQ